MLDASALLTYIMDEKGMEVVEEKLEDELFITSINLSEVVATLLRKGIPIIEIPPIISSVSVNVVDVGIQLAYEAALLEQSTKAYGLSLGDRMCLAAAQQAGNMVLTADRAWAKLKLPNLRIQVIR